MTQSVISDANVRIKRSVHLDLLTGHKNNAAKYIYFKSLSLQLKSCKGVGQRTNALGWQFIKGAKICDYCAYTRKDTCKKTNELFFLIKQFQYVNLPYYGNGDNLFLRLVFYPYNYYLTKRSNIEDVYYL